MRVEKTTIRGGEPHVIYALERKDSSNSSAQ